MRQQRVLLARDKQSGSWKRQALRWLNLRPEESERTFLMFAFYTLTSVGVLWLEVSVAALFLGEYGAESLPWIYIASAGIGAGLGTIYSWMQRFLPLRRVIVLTAVLMALPLLLFRIGLHPAAMGGYVIFLMRLWLEAIYVINELNTSITANQLFTIREIKRTYPLISSGILAADVVSGLSLPLLRSLVGLPNVILLACLMLLGGAAILLHLTRSYHQFFPEATRRRSQADKEKDFKARQLDAPQRYYVMLVFAFFIMVQVLALLLDFQYLSQLEQGMSVDKIADFLALFSAILGTVELATQWFVSGRVIERLGVFVIATLPPLLLVTLSTLTLTGILSLFIGVLILKFVDELLRYTFVASTGPILFQPIPDSNRSRIQSIVRGIAEPLSSGLTGAAMLATLWLFRHTSGSSAEALTRTQNLVFLVYTALFSLVWLLTVLKLRSQYLEVLVLSSDRGQLSLSYVDLTALKRSLLEALGRAQSDEERKSCIELLAEVDPQHVGKVVAPLLPTLSSDLQRQSLEAMLNSPNPAYLEQVRSLLEHPLPTDVLALALRYVYITAPEPDLSQLQPYLKPEVDPTVRSTAAAMMLQRGNSRQKAEATDTLRRMLTSKQERERVMGCRALGDAVYLQYLRLYIKTLLQDESLRVRCAMLEAIAATHLEEYYPSLLRGLYYKSTREAARHALRRLGDEAIPLLVEFAEDASKPEGIRAQAWITIGQIATPESIALLVSRLITAWGATRRTLLKVLLKVPNEAGIEALLELGRQG
ncbi:MAG TPA: HEAT repeat domain-containing protein, partial [Allocoleopsis sp.]